MYIRRTARFLGIQALRKVAPPGWDFKADLRQIGHGVGGLCEFLQSGHYGWAGEEFAEEVDFAAEFVVEDGLDEFFGGGESDGIELGDLVGGGAGDLERFAFGSELRDQAYGMRACRVNATASEKQIADEGVA